MHKVLAKDVDLEDRISFKGSFGTVKAIHLTANTVTFIMGFGSNPMRITCSHFDEITVMDRVN